MEYRSREIKLKQKTEKSKLIKFDITSFSMEIIEFAAVFNDQQ
jgi:hypothetical protein